MLYPKVATIPDSSITNTLLNFCNSLTRIARKVKGIAKLNPNSSGIIGPKITPVKVDNCQINQRNIPDPIK